MLAILSYDMKVDSNDYKLTIQLMIWLNGLNGIGKKFWQFVIHFVKTMKVQIFIFKLNFAKYYTLYRKGYKSVNKNLFTWGCFANLFWPPWAENCMTLSFFAVLGPCLRRNDFTFSLLTKVLRKNKSFRKSFCWGIFQSTINCLQINHANISTNM